MIVSQWSPENMATHKLSSVWVKAGGVPDDLLNYFSFCIVGSLVGTVQAIDMETFRAKDVIRIRVGVMDHTKVPNMALLTVDPYIYRIRFELEQVIKIGGPMSGGILIPRAPDFGEGGGFCELLRDPKRFKSVDAAMQPATSGGSDMMLSSQPEAENQGGGGYQATNTENQTVFAIGPVGISENELHNAGTGQAAPVIAAVAEPVPQTRKSRC